MLEFDCGGNAVSRQQLNEYNKIMDEPQEPIEAMEVDEEPESSVKNESVEEAGDGEITTENADPESTEVVIEEEVDQKEEEVDKEALLSDLLEELFAAKNVEVKKITLKKIEKIFRSKDSQSEQFVDMFLQKFLLPAFQLQGSSQSQYEKLKKTAENVMFVENSKFLNQVLTRLMEIMSSKQSDSISIQDSEKVFLFMLDTSQKLRSIPKFVLHILRAAKADGVSTVNFSNEFKEKFAECSIKMPVTQSITIWSNFCDTLQQEYTEFSENPSGSFVNVQAAAELVSISLLNVKLADYSIREETITQVADIFSTMESKLKLLVEMAIQKPQTFTRSLLKMAFAYGELHQLLLLYSQPYAERNAGRCKAAEELNEKDGGEKETQLWNFNYFHRYADESEWRKLAELTVETDIDLWAQLILQKTRFLLLFSGRGRTDKTVRNLIGFLVDHHSDCQALWLNNAKYLLPYMSAKQIKFLGQEIVNSKEMSRVLLDSEVVERRSLQMAVVHAVFQKLSEPLTRKRKADEDLENPPSPGDPSHKVDVLTMLSGQADVWIKSMDVSTKEVNKRLREAAERNLEMMTSTRPMAAERDDTRVLVSAEKLFSYLDLVDKLPLEYASGSVHSALLMALVSLLLKQEATIDTLITRDRMWMMVVRLLDNCEKLSSLYDHLPSATFLSWAVEHIKDVEHSAIIFETLFDQVLKSPKGLKDVAQWIESADFGRHLAVMVVATEKVAQFNQTVTNDAKKKLSMEMLDALQTRFLDCFEACLDDGAVDVLKGALCLLKMTQQGPAAPRCSKESAEKAEPAPTPGEEATAEAEETPRADAGTVAGVAAEEPSKVKRLLRKLNQLVEVARKGLLSADDSSGSVSAQFLGFLLSHQKRFADFLPGRMRISVWDAYRQSCHPLRWEDHLIRNLLSNARPKELTLMVNGILQDLQSVSLKVDPHWSDELKDTRVVLDELQRVSCFFRHLIAADMKTQFENSRTVRLQAIQTALPLVQHMILVLCHQTDGQVVDLMLPLMGIYLSFLTTAKFHGYPQDIASPLHACLALPLDEHMEHKHFIGVFSVIYKVIQYLLTKHEEIAADRIPVVLQALRRLLAVTAIRSDQRRKGDSSEVADLAECANRLSRLASIMNSQRIRYRRVAAYVVADIMEQFQRRTLYPSVKHDLLTTLHHLLDILDQHASRYLLSVLPAGVRELFRVEYEQFDRFYRFKGKV